MLPHHTQITLHIRPSQAASHAKVCELKSNTRPCHITRHPSKSAVVRYTHLTFHITSHHATHVIITDSQLVGSNFMAGVLLFCFWSGWMGWMLYVYVFSLVNKTKMDVTYCDVASHHVKSRHTTHTTSCPFMSHHTTSCRFTSRHDASCHVAVTHVLANPPLPCCLEMRPDRGSQIRVSADRTLCLLSIHY